MYKGKAVYWLGSNKLVNGEINIGDINKGEAVIEVKYCGICGTDVAIYKGLHPRAKPPLIMGHEVSGIIVNVKSVAFKKGDRVVINPLISCGECFSCKMGKPNSCQNLKLIGIDKNGGFAKYLRVSVDNIYKIPDEVDFKKAALIEPFALAARTFKKTKPHKNDLVVILGGGPIGLAIGLFFKNSGIKNICISEISEYRLNLLKKYGFNIINPKENQLFNEINSISEGKMADIVIMATGSAGPVKDMVAISKVGGLIAIVGIINEPTAADLMNIAFKELTIKGIRVYDDENFRKAVSFVSENSDILNYYVSNIFPIDVLEEAIKAAANSDKTAKILMRIA